MGRDHRYVASHRITLLLLTLFVLSFPACAQDESTAKKSSDLSIFAGFNFWNPDIGNLKDHGATIGVDYTKYIRHWPVSPSFEARVNRSSGPSINESSYLIGMKVQGQVAQRFHPYVDLLWGRGTIHYNNRTFYPGDNTATIDFGAGLDFDLNKRWQAKIDWQSQRWQPSSTQVFHPSGLTFGIAYRFLFRTHVSHADTR